MVGALAFLGFRAIMGSIFVAHGYPKLFGGTGKPVSETAARILGPGFVQAVSNGGISTTATHFREMGIPFPYLMAWFVSLLEFAGGILLIAGWLTRPTALLLASEMVVAIQKVHWRNGLIGPGGFEFPLAMLAGCLGLFGAGPGDLSIDDLISDQNAPGRREGQTPSPPATPTGGAIR